MLSHDSVIMLRTKAVRWCLGTKSTFLLSVPIKFQSLVTLTLLSFGIFLYFVLNQQNLQKDKEMPNCPEGNGTGVGNGPEKE